MAHQQCNRDHKHKIKYIHTTQKDKYVTLRLLLFIPNKSSDEYDNIDGLGGI